MALFDIPTRQGKSNDLEIAKKSKSKQPKSTTSTVGGGLIGKIKAIIDFVNEHLGQYKEETILIRDVESLQKYINACISNGVVAIDTETTGLDPMIDKIVGLCLYTPNQKTAYVPINHVSYITLDRITNQLTESEIAPILSQLDGIDSIMFNAPFDTRFIKHNIGVILHCTWDCYLGARLLNENEGDGNNGLKALHQKYVLDGQADAFSFGALFKGVTFDKVPIEVAALYAAHDPKITYELYEFQKQFLYYDKDCTLDDRNGMNGVSWVFENIEMPCVQAVIDMEDSGIELDLAYTQELATKYHTMEEQIINEFNEQVGMYGTFNIASPTQLSNLLYDVLKIPSPDPKNPRGTGDDILAKMEHPIIQTIKKYREVSKLLSTYIDKLPNCVNPNDGRIHCKFNQYGADTGRFSSQDPNLQNIPSHGDGKAVRKMFKATDGYVLMSSDFSQQEQCEYIKVDRWCEVETLDGWVYADTIVVGDVLKTQDDFGKDTTIIVNKIVVDKSHVTYYY